MKKLLVVIALVICFASTLRAAPTNAAALVSEDALKELLSKLEVGQVAQVQHHDDQVENLKNFIARAIARDIMAANEAAAKKQEGGRGAKIQLWWAALKALPWLLGSY